MNQRLYRNPITKEMLQLQQQINNIHSAVIESYRLRPVKPRSRWQRFYGLASSIFLSESKLRDKRAENINTMDGL